MTKAEYLKQLEKHLRKLPSEDYENAMEYFHEYFDEVDEDGIQQAIEELGTPREAATEVISRLMDEQLVDGAKKTGLFSIKRNIASAVLLVFAAPIGLPLLAAALILILAAVIVAVSILISGFAVSLALLLAGIKLLIRGFMAMTVLFSGGLLLSGMALLSIGFSFLIFVLVVYCGKWIGIGTAFGAKRIVKRR